MHALPFLLAGVAAGLIAGCQPGPAASDAKHKAELDAKAAEINKLEQRIVDLEAKASAPVEAPAAASREAVSEPEPVTAAAEPVDLCWQDYCPCEPPQGGPDQGLCRQLRAGIPVDDQIMSGAAMMRDARQQLADFEAEHGSFN